METRNLFYRVVTVIILVAVLLLQSIGIPARSVRAQDPIYLPIVMKAPVPVTVTPPQETDQNGTTVFYLPQANVQVTIQDLTGQPVQGMRVALASNGEKVLMVAEDPDGRYVPTFQESVLPQGSTTTSALEPASVPWHSILEVVHLAVEGKHIYDLAEELPDLTEYNLAYHEECWDVDQIATALSITGGIIGGLAHAALGITVGVGGAIVLPDLLTDHWCAHDWDNPTIIRFYHFPALQGKLIERRGPCPNRPPEDICSGRVTLPLSGYVRDARNLYAIGGAYVFVEPDGPGTYSIDGGYYEISNVPVGYHSVTARKEGYVSQSQIINIEPKIEGNTADFLLSPVGSGDEYRFVLRWGENPSDLDSHLWLPSAHPYHVYYANRGRLDLFPYAALDHDDTTSYGPETITMIRSYDGTYIYAVYHYYGSGSLATSGAQVEIYRGDVRVQQVQVPTSGSGRWWVVATVDGTTGYVITYNYITDTSPAPY